MKTKLRLTERNFINLIKKIVLEATPYVPQDDMNDTDYLIQRDAEQQQPIAQPIAQPRTQRQVACQTTGYRQKSQGPYGLCDKSMAIENLQKKLQTKHNIAVDGKLGPKTLLAIQTEFGIKGKKEITDDEIKSIVNKPTTGAVGVKNTPYKLVSPLVDLNRQVIKISNNNLLVLSIYARYDRIWAGEFTIYINGAQPGSGGGKKYTYATKCSLLTKNQVQIPGTIKNYEFNDPNNANTIRTHFCQKKSNQV